MTESETAERLCGFECAVGGLQLGLRAKFPEIQIKLYTAGFNEDEVGRRLADGCSWVAEKIGNHVFSEDGQPMERVIGALLRQRKETLDMKTDSLLAVLTTQGFTMAQML